MNRLSCIPPVDVEDVTMIVGNDKPGVKRKLTLLFHNANAVKCFESKFGGIGDDGIFIGSVEMFEYGYSILNNCGFIIRVRGEK